MNRVDEPPVSSVGGQVALRETSVETVFRRLLVGRAATLVSIVLVVALVQVLVDTSSGVRPILLLLLYLLLLNIPYAWVARRWPHHTRSLALLVILSDTLYMPVGQHLLGGANAIYALPLFGILIVMAATIHSARAAYAVAVAAAASYGAMVLATGQGWIPVSAGPSVFSIPNSWISISVLTNLLFNLALAVVASTLSGAKDRALSRSSEAERKLRELNVELESRVLQATHALQAANTFLAEKNKELGATIERVNLFAGAVSHDLRNPITAAGESLRLASEADSERRPRLVALARDNLLRADEMLVGLRDLMRTVGTRAFPRRVDVGDLVREVADEIVAARGERGRTVDIASNLGALVVRSEHLTHVFRNLIGNAFDHNSDVDDLEVEVGRDLSTSEPTFYVRDNGVGIPEEMHASIFEPFHRGGREGGEGLGLGLALVEAIVEQAGGQVSVESSTGRGATFRFTLPGLVSRASRLE